jgi:hypothetical protein
VFFWVSSQVFRNRAEVAQLDLIQVAAISRRNGEERGAKVRVSPFVAAEARRLALVRTLEHGPSRHRVMLADADEFFPLLHQGQDDGAYGVIVARFPHGGAGIGLSQPQERGHAPDHSSKPASGRSQLSVEMNASPASSDAESRFTSSSPSSGVMTAASLRQHGRGTGASAAGAVSRWRPGGLPLSVPIP